MWKLISKLIGVLFFSGSLYAVPPVTATGIKMGSATGVVKLTSGQASANATTTDMAEGANLYFTNSRVAALLNGGDFSTTVIPEGTNLYYTAARFNTAFAAKTTTDLAEGANLYFTNARAVSALSSSLSGKEPAITAGTTAQFWRGDKAWTDFTTTALASLGASAAKSFDWLNVGVGAAASTNAVLIMKDGHEKSTQTTAPTAAVNANAGTSATCTLSNATDIAGKLTLTSGALLSISSGVQCTVTFNKAYNVAPVCTFSPATTQAAGIAASNFFTTTTTTMVVNFSSIAVATQTYTWHYRCTETQ